MPTNEKWDLIQRLKV